MTHSERLKARRLARKEAASELIEEAKNELGDDPVVAIGANILDELKAIRGFLAKINYRQAVDRGEV